MLAAYVGDVLKDVMMIAAAGRSWSSWQKQVKNQLKDLKIHGQ
jgi:hypothetical protein